MHIFLHLKAHYPNWPWIQLLTGPRIMDFCISSSVCGFCEVTGSGDVGFFEQIKCKNVDLILLLLSLKNCPQDTSFFQTLKKIVSFQVIFTYLLMPLRCVTLVQALKFRHIFQILWTLFHLHRWGLGSGTETLSHTLIHTQTQCVTFRECREVQRWIWSCVHLQAG